VVNPIERNLMPENEVLIDWLAPASEEAEEEPVYECPECGTEHPTELDVELCCPTFECDHCGAEHPSEDEAYDCCRHYCGSCGTEYRYEDEAYDCCRYSCPGCGAMYDYEEDANGCCGPRGASYPSLSDLPEPYLISVPEIEGRPARVCSIEQEINDGGSEALQMLYDFGFADGNEQSSYSSQGRPGRVTVKSDASLSGEDSAEIVYSRYRLWEPASSRDLSLALGRMRQLAREANVVRVNKSAGTHIHISALAEDGTGIGPVEMAALHEIFCYAEDFLYSVAAAGWDAHRSRPGSGGYCKPVPKIPSGQKATGFRVNGLMARDRYFGLNFQRLIGCASNCSCGAARFGEWGACECGAFDAATVEWRLFNASTKPETLHAWLILAHSLTAAAFGHTVGSLPVNEYGTSDLEGRMAVQRWIEANAPMTDDEILVVREAVRRSPGLGRPGRR
jgi:hypothetical protein